MLKIQQAKDMFYEHAPGIFWLIVAIWATNLLYGSLHESAHALIVEMNGGSVYGIYVNPFGPDAWTSHSVLNDRYEVVMLNSAGLIATTLLGFVALATGYTPATIFLTLRSCIYALNYTPGTDISNIYNAIGNHSILISMAIISLNILCAAMAVNKAGKTVKDLSSSLSHEYLQSSNSR